MQPRPMDKRAWIGALITLCLLAMVVLANRFFCTSSGFDFEVRAGLCCRRSLDVIRRDIEKYRSDSKGHFPDRLGTLYECYGSDPRWFLCPVDRDAPAELKNPGLNPDVNLVKKLLNEGKSSYEYLWGYVDMRKEGPMLAPKTIIAFDYPLRHRTDESEFANVLFANGNIEAVDRQRLLGVLRNMTSFKSVSLDGKKRLWKLIKKIDSSTESK
jgi:hypothetical protein